ncbi:MAG TPA: SDR family NAD(P)-dependent oxidoreductase [Porticoccaceae bacterium]
MKLGERYGPWALILGASEGTGASFAHKLAAQGIHCILVARREGPLQALAAEIHAAHGVDCLTLSVDLCAPRAVESIIASVGDREVGLLITNAGADGNGSAFLETDVANWLNLINLNVLNTVRSCHHFAGLMRERGRGGIILVGSGACYGGMPGISVYAGSKAFVQCFAEGLWGELRPHGVDVLNLVLGRTDTPAHRELMARLGVPMPDGLASADEVAEVGLARLPHGPVHNWGLEDDQSGYASSSAAARRERVLALSGAAPGSSK